MSPKDLENNDRRIKWGLLIFSLLTMGLLMAAALQENVFPQWRQVRLDYARILHEKATDPAGRTLAAQFEICVQQNVVPELNATDRCITCHTGIDDPRMADQAQPYRTHPGTLLQNHPPEKFGCTICHRGQGRAITHAEAKAVGYHWDYPQLPVNLTQSACGVCHPAGEVAGRGGEKYALGKQLFETKGCQGCHKLEGRGGNLGPALDGEGLKVAEMLPMAHIKGEHTLPQWLSEHFDDPQKVSAGSQMHPPQLSRAENEALTIYILSLQDRELPRNYLSPAKHLEYYQQFNPEPATGAQLYTRFCATCHEQHNDNGFDKILGKFIPVLHGADFVQTASPQFIEANIRQGRPGTLMPAWATAGGGLRDEEISRIRQYLLSTPVAPADALPAPLQARVRDPQYVARGNAKHGAELYAQQCLACHGPDGAGLLAPSLNNQVLQQQASDGFLFVTIARGRKGTAMPAYLAPAKPGLSESDIADVIAYLHTLGKPLAPDKPGQ